MFSSLEVGKNSLKSSERLRRMSRLSSGLKVAPNRRLVSQLMCRLPILIVWTLMVIFILFKMTSGPSPGIDGGDLSKPFPFDEYQGLALTSTDINLQASQVSSVVELSSPSYKVSKVIKTNDESRSNKIRELLNIQKLSTISHPQTETNYETTTKESSKEYTRSSKVFILNIHVASHPPVGFRNGRRQQRSNNVNVDANNHKQLRVLPHIRLLMNILESHRITYTIDTTRDGLPAALLNDLNSTKNGKQFSVIVIDDFIKYTKLNRWIRDQLDRHCRANEIGVITYLTGESADSEGSRRADQSRRKRHESASPSTKAHFSGNKNSEEAKLFVGDMSHTNDDGSIALADQFPLKFKSLDQQKSCRNISSNMCLVDYQLNERSPVLRVLKRKQNFILNGPLIENLDDSPWISMSSNHITYQPITWARARGRVRNEEQINDLAMNVSTQARDSHFGERHETELMTQRLGANNNIGYGSNEDERPFVSDSSSGRREQTSTTATATNSSSAFRSASLDEAPIQSSDRHGKSSSNDSVLTASADVSHPAPPQLDNKLMDTLGIGDQLHTLVMLDRGLYDGIRRVIFGGANHHWMNRILLLDSIEHLSSGQILSPLDRYIQIDIDDIFVGERGKRMNASDVHALIETQEKFARLIEGGFKFNLGFSGKYFHRGSESENEGDDQLIAQASQFNWFCHFWSHSKAHLFNSTEQIVDELAKNLNFAHKQRLPMIGHKASSLDDFFSNGTPLPPTYAIAPHHSGVYPIHEQLYDAWRSLLNVQVTSTEEYPHLRLASSRRGFVHKAIKDRKLTKRRFFPKVLPRQTCGLYTHNIYRDKYPGGIDRLTESIKGGELFETILHNPVNIYMTHMSNYAHDRLALDTFSALIEFVQANTNLQLKFAPTLPDLAILGPQRLADYYFDLYPEDKTPLWTNPCSDKRHLSIWSSAKLQFCSNTPKLLVVGPQKTGTSALHAFLKINPQLRSSKMSSTDFEEVQFFNDKHYSKGVDWYFERFDEEDATNSNSTDENYIYFDKSATYFDDPKVPRRAKALLPGAKIVIVLIDPADRAYSWYQHQRAHNDPAATSISFERLIAGAPNGTDSEMDDRIAALRSRCLHPGYYAKHLLSWLDYYPSKQVIIVDGEWLKQNPASVMFRLQLMLHVQQPIDYGRHLVFDFRKGFYCQLDESTHRSKCLGESKGRQYEPMSREARVFLNGFYFAHNKQLARILTDIGQPLPNWLDNIMGITHSSSVIRHRLGVNWKAIP